MDCAKADPYRPVWTNKCRWLAVVLWLGSGFMDGALCWGQRDSAATESEWSETTPDRLRGDVHRDDDLAGLPAMDATLYGREHLSRFLTGPGPGPGPGPGRGRGRGRGR